jgi:GNAT superfamily N-acetyltransferase
MCSHEHKVSIEIEEINQDQAESLCRNITADLPEYFGIPSANEQYFAGVRTCKNLAAKINNYYVGLLSLNFPYPNNSNIYWMAVLRDHQSVGVGSRLVQAACQFAKRANATSMTVETLSPDESDDNYLKTYQFYQSLGFNPLINIKPEGYAWNMVYLVKSLK